jgi:hypothetical protein
MGALSSAAGVGSGGGAVAATADARALGATSAPTPGLPAERSHSATAATNSTAAATTHRAILLRWGEGAADASEAERESGGAVVAVAWNAPLDSANGAASRSAPLSLMHSLRSASAASRAEEKR